jgi:Na+(H+)/acetate symporter ActP
MIDYYKRIFVSEQTDAHYVAASKILTVIWGVLAIIIAISAHLFDNLIQLVNILGSLFYGTILGIFLVAFFLKKITQKPLLIGAICGQSTVLVLHVLNTFQIIDIGYLWYNVIGSAIVVIVSWINNILLKEKSLKS